MVDEKQRSLKQCECSICDTTFYNGTIPSMAKKIANHWNEEHGSEFYDVQPFDEIKYGGHNVAGDDYVYTIKQLYITAYDVINVDGDTPFKYEYVKNVEMENECSKCYRNIENVNGYTKLDTDENEYQTFICSSCEQERIAQERSEKNESLADYGV